MSRVIASRMSPDFAAELHAHRGYLLRVAQLQLRDRDSAEDVVQETLLAAIAGRERFTGRSSVKTWLTGILKHKIVDAIRRRQRDAIFESSLPDDVDLEEFEGLFRRNGAWETRPSDWGGPRSRSSCFTR